MSQLASSVIDVRLASITPLAISFASLAISFFTAYWNILRGAKFVSPPLRWIIFGLLPGANTLVINFPVTVTNTGSSTGVIDSFYIDLTNLETHKVERFYAWQESKLTPEEFKGFGIEVPTPVSLKAGESLVKYYIFHPHSENFMLYSCGIYKISLHAYLNGRKKALKLYEQKLEIVNILKPSLYPHLIPTIHSFNLFPKKILKVSNYGNEASPPSIIEITKK